MHVAALPLTLQKTHPYTAYTYKNTCTALLCRCWSVASCRSRAGAPGKQQGRSRVAATAAAAPTPLQQLVTPEHLHQHMLPTQCSTAGHAAPKAGRGPAQRSARPSEPYGSSGLCHVAYLPKSASCQGGLQCDNPHTRRHATNFFGGGGGGGRVCTTLHPPPGCTCLRLTASSVGSSSHPQTCCSKCQLGHAALPCSASRATGVDNPPGAQVHGCVVMPLPLRCHDGDTSSFRGAQGSCCSCCLLMLSTGMLPCSLLLCNHHCV